MNYSFPNDTCSLIRTGIYTTAAWSSLAVGTFRRSGSQSDIWQNGGNIASSSSVGSTIGASQMLWIGCMGGVTNYPLDGQIAEIIFFASGMSDVNRTALETNQKSYYGTP